MSLKSRVRHSRRLIDQHQPWSAVALVALGVVMLVLLAVTARVVWVSDQQVTSPGCADPDGNIFLRGNVSIEHEGAQRGTRVALQRENLRRATPLVVALMGDGMVPDDFRAATELPEVGLVDGFMTAIPTLSSVGAEWDLRPDGSDAAFVLSAIDELEDRLCVRTDRRYLVGFGAGGSLALQLACLEPDRYAGVAVVGGLVEVPDCTSRDAVPLIAIHGTDDDTFPFDGSHPDELAERLRSAGLVDRGSPRDDIAARWAEVNDCEDSPDVVPAGASVARVRWQCPLGGGVELYRIERGRHVWPNPSPAPDVPAGAAVRHSRLDASQLIWEFLDDQWLGVTN